MFIVIKLLSPTLRHMKNLILALFLIPLYSYTQEILISGNSRTHKDVILVEIKDLKPVQENIKEIRRRIWNLRIFSEVKVEKTPAGIEIKVQERWTTIPIFKLTGGGGSSYLAVGMYDINAFGKNLELGAQYESLNERPAGVVWFRKPQFLNDRSLRAGMDFWNINRLNFIIKENGDENGAFTLQRKRIHGFLEKNWDNNFYTLTGGLDYHDDEISDFGIDDENVELNTQNGFNPNEKSITRNFYLRLAIGQLNFQNYLADGKQLTLRSMAQVTSYEGEDSTTMDHLIRFRYFKLFENHHNFAYQFLVKGTNSKLIQYQQTLGGLSEVRGYLDQQFRDSSYWQSNIEHRFDVYEHKWAVIQGVIFSDQAKEFTRIDKLDDENQEILLSSGVGLRLISPKIYSFVARLDYAQTHTRDVERGISFGVQQFF